MAIRQLIDAGYGFGILPYAPVQLDVQKGHYQISRLVKPFVSRQLVVTTSAHRTSASSLAMLMRLIKKVLAEAVDIEPPARMSATAVTRARDVTFPP